MVVRQILATLVVAPLLVSCSGDGSTADPPDSAGSTTREIQTVGAPVELPSCKGAAPGMRCHPVELCEPDDGSTTGHAQHLYLQERLHGREYLVMGECEPGGQPP